MHWMMTVQLNKECIRDKILEFLIQNEIDCRQMVYPIHLAKHFESYYNQKNFPVSKKISLSSIHLPSATNLKRENIEKITEIFLQGLKLYG